MRVSVADFCYKIVSSTQCRHGPHRAPHTPPTTWTESSACCVNMKGLKGWVRTWLVIATRARLACRCRQPNVELLSPRNGTSSWRHGASLAGSHCRIVYSTRMDPLVGVTGKTFRGTRRVSVGSACFGLCGVCDRYSASTRQVLIVTSPTDPSS